nr:VP3 [Yunnan orbivirus]
MAEYGILVWRDKKKGNKSIPPEEYDIFIDLDETIEPKTKTDESLIKVTASEKIFKDVGSVDTLQFQTTFSTYKASGLTKRETSEIVMPTFIDKCITRLSESKKQEPLQMAVARAKMDPRKCNIGYEYVSNGFYSLQVTHSKILLKKNALQTVSVDRISMCTQRPHLDGIDRLYSQMLALKLFDVKMGKISKARNLTNLSSEVSSDPCVLFLLEFKPYKLTVQPLTADTSKPEELYNEIDEAEETNAVRRAIHVMEKSDPTDIKEYFDDLVEEIKDSFSDSKILTPITLYAKVSKYLPEVRIVMWKVNNISGTKATLANVSQWKDLTRLPIRVRGIMSALVHPINDVFETTDTPDTFKMVDQPATSHNAYWLKWWNEHTYRQQETVEKRMKLIYGKREPGCMMEKIVLVNYLETLGFLYNLVGRYSGIEMRMNLYPGIFKRTLGGIHKVTDERRKQIIKEERDACDTYLHNHLFFDDWDEQLLFHIRRLSSLPAAFLVILRAAFGETLLVFDSEDFESDLNLVLLGQSDLDSFLSYYLPPLTNLAQKANNLNGRATIGEMLQAMCNYNLLIVFLSLFGDVSPLHHRTGGYRLFKRQMAGKYLLPHIVPAKDRTNHPQGLCLHDILLHLLGTIPCDEFLVEYVDPYDGLDQEAWTAAWDKIDEEATQQIEDDKIKYGEKAETWAVEQKAKVATRRKNALYRWNVRRCLKSLFSDAIFGKRSSNIVLQTIEGISRLRMNYQEISMLMASQCRGFTDVVTVCYPITSPHRSIIVITIYSFALTIEDALSSVMRRFPRNFENIFQHVLVQIGPDETSYTTKITNMSTSDRLRVKGLGPMSTKLYPYTLLGVDAHALIIKHAEAKRGSPFFFVKIAGAE